MCVSFPIDEDGREKLGLASGILQVLLAVFGVILIVFAIVMKLILETKLLLLETYNSGAVAYFLIALGCIMFVVNVFGAKVAFDCGVYETRQKFQNMMTCVTVILICLCIIIITGGILCFVHSNILPKYLHNGLFDAFKLYKHDVEVKETIDRLQLDFKCCGSKGYADWFTVSWINNSYINTKDKAIAKKIKDGEYFVDSVPFSCCSIKSTRPCIHHDVTNRSAHLHYGDVTLYKRGCTNVLGNFFAGRVLVPAGQIVFIVFGIELLVLIMFRLLQTSIISAFEEGEPRGIGGGFLFPSCFAGGDSMKYIRRRDKEQQRAQADEDYDEDDEDAWDKAQAVAGRAQGQDNEAYSGDGDAGGGAEHGSSKKDKKQKDKSKKDKSKEKSKKDKKSSSKEKKKSSPKEKKKSSPKEKKKSSPKDKKSLSPKPKSSPKTMKMKQSPAKMGKAQLRPPGRQKGGFRPKRR